MEIVPVGDTTLIVRLGTAAEDSNASLAAMRRLQNAQLRGVIETAPAYNTLGVFYDAAEVGFDELAREIETALAGADAGGTVTPGRVIDIPVCYGGDLGPDLDDVAKHTGLTSDEVIARHSAAEYVVSCVGFTPGFPYLSGLPNELSIPRRATPRKQVPVGAVAIGGSQTGVYPTSSPGGWHLIGRTRMRLFDVQQNPPALLQPGDRVRFRAITRDEFEA
jgi:inhibitor of KinA